MYLRERKKETRGGIEVDLMDFYYLRVNKNNTNLMRHLPFSVIDDEMILIYCNWGLILN